MEIQEQTTVNNKPQADKANTMTKEELLSKVSESVGSGDEEYNKVLSSPPNVLRTLDPRQCTPNINNNTPTPAVGDKKLSPAEERAQQAEIRTASRQARMKDLEDDAIRAQAVIAKAQEMQNDERNKAASSQNGEPEVEVTKRQIIELNLEDSNSQLNSSNESR